MSSYLASPDRYQSMDYRRCGTSGLKLPAISLGLWHNFGGSDDHDEARTLLHRAFDAGITHFDLANNYGPPPGSAESVFGRFLRQDFSDYRDELILSTKAGHLMWDGPYGDWASKKHLTASLDQSLKRMAVDYVDIFYTHRPDPETPIEETAEALAGFVRQGKALYIGISKYDGESTRTLTQLLREQHVPVIIHQHIYNMLNRWPENAGVFPVADELGLGCICFSPLAQGMLTEKYLDAIPQGSRADRPEGFLTSDQVEENRQTLRGLKPIAEERGESLATMALAWLLQNPSVTSALIGARTVAQLQGNLLALKSPTFSDEQVQRINTVTEVLQKTAQSG